MRLGNAFFGESMFALRPNASKAAFLSLARRLFADGLAFIDCQVPSGHLASLGGTEISRRDFLALLERTLAPARDGGNYDGESRRGNWGER
jgi:leucyl/phenylalanyl-tRNA--protein transferase